jgi:hypothetical protein
MILRRMRMDNLTILEDFMTCWKDHNWSEMKKYIQKSQITEDIEEILENFFGHIFIKEYTITKDKTEKMIDTSDMKDYVVKIKAESFGDLKRIIRIICENGEWGINPISGLRPG